MWKDGRVHVIFSNEIMLRSWVIVDLLEFGFNGHNFRRV